MDKNQVVELNIGRFDSYIERADNKASFILALVTAILGGSIFQYKEILSNKNCELKGIIILLLVLFIFSMIATIVLCIKTLIPRTKNTIAGEFSIFYFKDVMNTEKFLENLDLKSEEEIDLDLKKQVSIIANVCNKKMNNIKFACISLVVGIFLGMILIILTYI